jgi:hypothetical protein
MPFIHAHPPDGNQTGSFRVILRRHTEDYWPAVRQMPVTNQFADRFAGPVHDFLTEKILYVHDHTHKLTLRTVYPQNKAGICPMSAGVLMNAIWHRQRLSVVPERSFDSASIRVLPDFAWRGGQV